MAIVIPIVTEYKNTGVAKATSDIQRAKGGWQKAGAGMRSALLPATAVVGAFGIAAFSAFKKAEESAKVTRKLANNLKGAGFPQLADEAEAYADSLSNITGIDDEVIKGAQAMLALNGKIASSATEMARATQLSADVAAAGGVSMEAAAKAVSKAYDDPLKGMAAFSKAGIKLTDEQKNSIKWLVAKGRAAEAQGILLDAVGEKTKGAAEASTTSTEKMATQWENLQETLGAVFLPVVDKIVKAFGGVSSWITSNQGLFFTFTGIILALSVAVIAVNAAMTAFTAIKAAIATVKLVSAAVKGWTVVQWALNASLLANPIILVVVGIIALVAILVVAYKKSETFRRIVDGAFRAVKAAAVTAFEWIMRNWPLLLAILTGPIGLAVLAIVKNKDKIVAAIKTAVSWIKGAWSGILDPAKDQFQSFYEFIKRIIDRIKGAWDSVAGIFDKVNPFGGVIGASGPTGFALSAGGVSRASSAVARSASGSGITVNVYGAIDPDSTGRKIRQILSDTETRLGSRRPRLVL